MLAAALSGLLLASSCLGVGATSPAFHPSGIQGRTAEPGVVSLQSPSVDVDSKGASERGSPVAEGVHDTVEVLSFSCTNEYKPVTGSPWEIVAEPFRETTLTAISTVGNPEEDTFKWYLGDGTVREGSVVTHTFTTLGWHHISVSQTDVSTGITYHYRDDIMVKYVRREIRQLTETDRQAFFDTMETIYRLSTEEGNAVYGENYRGIKFFVQMHLDGAGITDCDHWHDDAGIMTHHVGYTLLFEQALQVVNPAVTIPYWEYTIEASMGLTNYGESIVFDDDWFGDASPANPLHVIEKGRWAYLPVMEDAWEYVHNAYGLLRTPWNLDATPYVTRHNKTSGVDSTDIVSCSTYQMCFDSSTLSDLNTCLNGGTHGPVHIKVGGEWDNPEEEFIRRVGYTAQVPLITKYLWRKGYLRLPDKCTVEENGTGDFSTCRSSCPVELYESRNMTAYDVLVDVKAIHWIAGYASGTIIRDEAGDRFVISGHEGDKEFQLAFWKKILLSLCDSGHTGDLFTSAAPYDPLFWVIHPTADRFLGWRRKLAREHPDGEYALDDSWGYSHGRTVGESGYICDWSDVREGTLDMPTCTKGICGGHRELDVLPFKIKPINGAPRKMSNLEWLDFVYPDNEDLPYMYNEFAWEDCAAAGYSIGTLSGS